MRTRAISTWTRRAVVVLTSVSGISFATPSVLAQDSVKIDVGDCVKLKSPGERLDCYERQVNAAEAQKAATPATPAPPAQSPGPSPAPTSTAPAAAAVPAAGAAAAAASSPAASAPPSAPARPPQTHGSSSSKSEKALPPDIVATITALRTMEPNTWLITLDNGQVWRQSYPQTFVLEPGVQVTLRASKWGSAYRLSAEGLNGYIQVQRVK